MLVAEYSTPKNSKNQVVVWDRIIMRDEPEKHIIAIKNGKPKYQFWDDGKHLKGTPAVALCMYIWCLLLCIVCTCECVAKAVGDMCMYNAHGLRRPCNRQ